MGTLAMFPMFIIVQVAFSCIPQLQPTEAPSEEPSPIPETPKPPEPKECLTVELNPGRPCVFPFTYQYKEHYECLPFKGRYWCALTPTYDIEQWGYCSEDLCPPTKTSDANVCGTNSALDAKHLIAEKNFPFLAKALNQVHPNPSYKTTVFDVVTVDSGGNAKIVMTSTNCPLSDPGLISLFIAPSSAICNAEILGSSSTGGLHHVLLSTSCNLDTVVSKFISDKQAFKQYFNGQSMKLCGARTWMDGVVATSRKQTLLDVFSFLYNTEATVETFDLDEDSDCKTSEETTQALQSVFDTKDVRFVSENYKGTEEKGSIEIQFTRTPTAEIGIALVQTNFESFAEYKPADIKDIVPYSGLVTFPASSGTASFFITVIQDNVTETDEAFQIEIIGATRTRDWQKDLGYVIIKYHTGESRTCPDQWTCLSESDDCPWEQELRLLGSSSVLYSVLEREYINNLQKMRKDLTCNTDGEGHCCPPTGRCIFNSKPTSMNIAALQCGRTGPPNYLPRLCNTNGKCYDTNTCILSADCKSASASRCNKFWDCAPCEVTQDCDHIPGTYCLKKEGNCVKREQSNSNSIELSCRGFWYTADKNPNQNPGPELEVIFDGNAVHLHLSDSFASMNTANYPWAFMNGQTKDLDDTTRKIWQPFFDVCQKEVGNQGLTWDIRNQRSFFTHDGQRITTTYFYKKLPVVLTCKGFWYSADIGDKKAGPELQVEFKGRAVHLHLSNDFARMNTANYPWWDENKQAKDLNTRTSLIWEPFFDACKEAARTHHLTWDNGGEKSFFTNDENPMATTYIYKTLPKNDWHDDKN